MLNGILWVPCSGTVWRDMPERFALGRRPINAFVTGKTQAPLTKCPNACMYGSTNKGWIDVQRGMIDSTLVRATRVAAGAGKKGGLKNRRIMRSVVAGVD